MTGSHALRIAVDCLVIDQFSGIFYNCGMTRVLGN